MQVKENSMFNFGLFTTHLPYLVFITVYLFYLLVGAGNKALDDGTRLSSDKIVVCQSFQSDLAAQSQKVTFCDCLYDQLNISTKLKAPDFNNTQLFLVSPDERVKGERYTYQTFSRPPPFLG